MSKVKVSAAEGQALSDYRGTKSLEYDVNYYIQNNKDWRDDFKPLKDMGFDKFVAALVNGWEVEKTPHERIKEYYDTNANLGNTLVTAGVRNTLKYLDIKIAGIN